LGIWPTNASRQFVQGAIFPNSRKFEYSTFPTVFTAHVPITSLTSQSISGAVPTSAKSASLMIGSTALSAALNVGAAADSTGTGGKIVTANNAGITAGVIGGIAAMAGAASFPDIPIITAQTVYVLANSAGSTNNMYVSNYGW